MIDIARRCKPKSQFDMGQICFNIVRALILLENLAVVLMASMLIYISFSAMDQDFGLDILKDNHPKDVHAYITAICAGIGIIIALVSILGLFGAVRKSKSALIMYGSIILSMVAILAILSLFSMTTRNGGQPYRDLDKSVVNATIAMYNHTGEERDVRRMILDLVQKKLSCCGINSPNDWKEYGMHKIPTPCCSNHTESSQPPIKYCEQSDYKTGCWKAMNEYFQANLSTARTFVYTIVGLGLMCSTAAFLMVRTLRKGLEVV